MGHDVIAIGQHKLNTISLNTTATDLAVAFDVSVRYGYTDDWIDPLTGKEANFEFVELGRTERQGKPLYTLQDSLYMDRLHDPKKYEREIGYDFYGGDYDKTSFYIYHDCFVANSSFDPRWWNFVRYFQGRFYGDDNWLQYITPYRREVLAEVTRLGGQVAMYGDDQGLSSFIEYDTMSQPFETVKQKVLSEFGSAVLDVSSFQRRYNLGVFEETEWLAFIDDFTDLK